MVSSSNLQSNFYVIRDMCGPGREAACKAGTAKNPPRKEKKTTHIKSDSCNGKRTGSAEPGTPRKSLRIYSWAENQEPRRGGTAKVWLTESNCCLNNVNIQNKRKEVENMVPVETGHGRLGGGKVKTRPSSEQDGDSRRTTGHLNDSACALCDSQPKIHTSQDVKEGTIK